MPPVTRSGVTACTGAGRESAACREHTEPAVPGRTPALIKVYSDCDCNGKLQVSSAPSPDRKQ